MNDELKQEVLQDWPDAVFVSKEDWLDCLVYQDETRNLYESWINKNTAAMYIIRYNGMYSMGARYGFEKDEYLSPYGEQKALSKAYRQNASRTA